MTLTGFSHVSLTVQDLEAARRFWVDVFGFAVRLDQPSLQIFVDPLSSATVACVTHADADLGDFDERRVGLDHVALDVADLEVLRGWEAKLAAAEVEHSPITESPIAWHLNVRAPDNIAVELLTMKPEGRALLGG